jgi:acyl-CoA thioesterase-1
MMKKILPILLLCIALYACNSKQVKVACIGDSITEGAGHEQQSKTAYPVILEQLLGADYIVLNAGRSGATMLKESDLSYWNCKEISNVFTYKPDIIIIKLGTNDSKYHNWNQENFRDDYQRMIDTLNTIDGEPQIYLCLPVPVFETKWGINDSTLNYGVIPTIKDIATTNNLSLIDLNTIFLTKPEYFPDAIHPNEKGAEQIAIVIADKLKNYK